LFMWISIIPGVIYTHIALSKLLPGVADLPTNIAAGFDRVLKFAELEEDSASIADAASLALVKCGKTPATGCSNYQVMPRPVNTTMDKKQIQDAFSRSLNAVKKVTSDPYFGVSGFENTDQQLRKILDELSSIDSLMPCTKAVPNYCEIHSASGSIVEGIGAVYEAIKDFEHSKVIERWEDNKQLFVFLHVLPYILVLGMLCFTFFWWKGGVCCCCKGGTFVGSLALPFFVVFWAAAFVIWAIIAITGTIIKYDADHIDVPVLKGKPTLEVAIEHIQTTFPEFWDLVFAPLVEGLELLLPCAWLFFGITILIGLYSMCECMWCPYRKTVEPISPHGKAGAEPCLTSSQRQSLLSIGLYSMLECMFRPDKKTDECMPPQGKTAGAEA